MREYELYVPLCYNDGKEVEPEKLERLNRRLLDDFGGVTRFPQESEGMWKIGGHVFRDRIVILRVLSDGQPWEREYFEKLSDSLAREWRQKSFLIIAREVSAISGGE